MNSWNLHRTLFAGRDLDAVLEDRFSAAIAAAGILTEADYIDGNPADRITDRHDVPDVPTVDWDTPRTVVQATAEQTVMVTTEWATTGNPQPLAWRPARHWLTVPPVIVGTAHGRIVAVVEAPTVTAQDTARAHAHARRYVDAHLTAIGAEIGAWRVELHRKVRAAVARRRRLLDDVATLTAP